MRRWRMLSEADKQKKETEETKKEKRRAKEREKRIDSYNARTSRLYL